MTVKPGPYDRAGTMRTFRTSRQSRNIVAIVFAVMLAVPAAVAFTPAARQSGLNAWGALAVLGSLAFVMGCGIAGMSREAVIVRDGKVTIRNVRSRTVDVSEIRAVTLGQVSRGDVPGPWVPQAELTNGEIIYLHALTCGRGTQPLDPERLALLIEFRVLVGLAAEPQIDELLLSLTESGKRDDA